MRRAIVKTLDGVALVFGFALAVSCLAPGSVAAQGQFAGVEIEGKEHLSRLLTVLQSRAATPATGRVRITHLGDSHVAADLWTGQLRARLQAQFGDGGRGYISAGRPWPSFGQQHVRSEQQGDWRTDGLRDGLDDGLLGPSTCGVASRESGAFVRVATGIKTTVARTFSRLEVHYLRQPMGACAEVLVDGRLSARFSTRGPWAEPAVFGLDVENLSHDIRLRVAESSNTAEVRLLGFDLTRGEGIIVDALGINGAQGRRLLRQDPTTFQSVFAALSPSLLLISYGTNELFDRNLSMTTYARDLDTTLRLLRASAPGADCLLTGPFDQLKGRRPPVNIDALYGVQREAAARNGCAFWDARSAMGGVGSVRAWRKRALVQKDMVHLTGGGYAKMGDLLADALIQLAQAPR